MVSDFVPLERVPLSERTTLGLGGRARFFAEVNTTGEILSALAWARREGVFPFLLGGGSNVVVADSGVDGLVLVPRLRGMHWHDGRPSSGGGEGIVTVGAGVTWDALVSEAVDRGFFGVECLSGIPGWVGASPVQNIGAYGQELSQCVVSVSAMRFGEMAAVEMPADRCEFGYRTSRFKREAGKWLVLGVCLRLNRERVPGSTYAGLEGISQNAEPGVYRERVLSLRRHKGMLCRRMDPAGYRSAGSFFVNPVLSRELFQRCLIRWKGDGLVSSLEEVPCHNTMGDRIKVPAAWLIERAGFSRGYRRGTVGVSPKHALSLVHYGGGTTEDLLGLARDIRHAVRARLGVELLPEAVGLGVDVDGATA